MRLTLLTAILFLTAGLFPVVSADPTDGSLDRPGLEPVCVGESGERPLDLGFVPYLVPLPSIVNDKIVVPLLVMMTKPPTGVGSHVSIKYEDFTTLVAIVTDGEVCLPDVSGCVFDPTQDAKTQVESCVSSKIIP